MKKVKITLLIILLVFTFVSPVVLAGENNNNREDISNANETPKNITSSQIEQYENRLLVLETKLKSNEDMFEVYRDYINNLLIIFTIVVALAVGTVQFYTGNKIENRVRQYINENYTQEQFKQIIQPELDAFMDEKSVKFDKIIEKNQEELSNLVRMARKGIEY